MSIAAKVAIDKQKHPENYCKVSGCLWKVVKLNHAIQQYEPDPKCPKGFCPRHQHLAPKSN
jgi:hypothetical protein